MEKKEPILTENKINEPVAKIDDTEFYVGEQIKKSKSKIKLTKNQKIASAVIAIIALIGLIVFFSTKKSTKQNITKKRMAITLPAFDIVRMEKGEAVIAGTAPKNTVVYVQDNGKKIGSEKSDENGQWVFIPKTALKVGNHKLSLYIIANGKKYYAKQSAVLHVSKKSNNEVAVLMGNKKSKVLKAPKGQNIGSLRIAKISYNEDGNFVVEGLAIKNSTVNIYMNNKLLETATANEFGIFTVSTKYEMNKSEKQIIRADMLSKNGKVLRRVAYNFTPVFYDGENDMTMIKKGDCLWNIALKEYGRGTEYLILFEANKSQIQDPNKIYVGQVFSIVKKDSKAYNSIKTKIKEEMKNKKK